MDNCLVTKYKSVVENDSLEYLEWLHINVKSETTVDTDDFSINVTTTPAKKLYIEGDGHFTDGTMTQDRGKIADTGNNQKFSNGNYLLKIPLTGIVALTTGSAQLANITKWQVNGLNFERLCRVNKDTLREITFESESKLRSCLSNTTKVTTFHLLNSTTSKINLMKILDAIVECDGRISDFSFEGVGLIDIYTPGSGNFTRNIHVISNTEYSVYSSSETKLLYTAQKVDGVWSHTLA